MPKFRIQFSLVTLLLVTSLVALYFACRDTDTLSLNMNDNKVLSLPMDSYQLGHGRWGLLNPKEVPLDRVLYRKCLEFEKLSSSDQVDVRNSIGDSTESSLWGFAGRSSVFALRNKDPDRVRAGITALAMMPTQHDYRDVYTTLGLLSRAAKELDVDLNVFAEIAAISEPHMAELMQDMVGRDPSGTDSQNFVETKFGVGYVMSDGGPYDANGDLLSISMRIAAAIEAVDSNYEIQPFTIGSETSPTYWLRPVDFERADVLQQVSSAVQFHATIDSKIAKYQRFVIDVYEINSFDTVERLQSVADSQGMVNETAVLACSHGNIFCIIGTRTYLSGGQTHETNASLNRFRSALETALKLKN